MRGFLLGQSYGYGGTFQHTVVAGVSEGAPKPVAGAATYTFNVQPWDWMRLVFCAFTLTTDANAGARYATIEYPGPQGVSVNADGGAFTVAASTTGQRFIGQLQRGTSEHVAGGDIFFPLSGMWLEVGRPIVLTIANVGAGDLLSNVSFTFDCTPVPGDGSEEVRAVAELARETWELAQAAAAASS